MLKKSLLTISLLTLAGCNTVAVNETTDNLDEPVETTEPELNGFECYPLFDNDEERPLLLLISDEHPDVGLVVISEVIAHPAEYAVRGLERHWSFGCDNNKCNYRIDLEMNGIARYYDFTHEDEVKSSATFKCK